MKQCVIITGGSIEAAFALSFIKSLGSIDLLIAADRGLVFFRDHDLMPDCIVGDFDSAGTDILKPYRERPEVEIRAFKPEKDWTDTEIAVELAMEKTAGEDVVVYLLGGTGSRLDHVLGNMQVMDLALQRGTTLVMVNANNKICMVGGETGGALTLQRETQFGDFVSLVPWGGAVEGLTLTGFKYPLDDFTLPTAGSRGISNEIEDEKAVIRFKKGKLLIIQSRD